MKIPFGSVVSADRRYTYAVLNMDCRALQALYPCLETGWIGFSALGNKIPALRLGVGKKKVCYCASFHANEWITTPVLMLFAERYLQAYAADGAIFGYSARQLFADVSIYLIPMVNPDGVDLVTGAIRAGTRAHTHAKGIAGAYPDIPFPDGWKANINGVDLNSNFPARWGQAKTVKFGLGFRGPAPRDYVGTRPLCAPEAYAVYRFTQKHRFRLILTYHTQGRVIFWQYNDMLPDHALAIGRHLSRVSGYPLAQTDYAAAFAGYKDWFIAAYNRPGYTVEAGLGENPLPLTQLDRIYAENEGILVLAATLAPTH